MGTDKKRISTYVEDEVIKKFKVVSAMKNKSMSEYAYILIQKAIEGYEVEHGEIHVED